MAPMAGDTLQDGPSPDVAVELTGEEGKKPEESAEDVCPEVR